MRSLSEQIKKVFIKVQGDSTRKIEEIVKWLLLILLFWSCVLSATQSIKNNMRFLHNMPTLPKKASSPMKSQQSLTAAKSQTKYKLTKPRMEPGTTKLQRQVHLSILSEVTTFSPDGRSFPGERKLDPFEGSRMGEIQIVRRTSENENCLTN